MIIATKPTKEHETLFLVWRGLVVFWTEFTVYEISPGRNSEKIERRTSNAQHRTSNMDGAALYLIL
jgi:hypothetical protein